MKPDSPWRFLVTLLLVGFLTSAASGEEESWTPLFNGRDLDGWVNVNCAPGTFSVRDGLIVCTGFPTGVLRTDRQYENFILELEYRHMKPLGNAGLFIWSDPITAVGRPFTRSIEVQILDGRNSRTHTSHGDVFPIHGATMKPDRPHPTGSMRCLPSEFRAKPAGEWNHYRVHCNDGVLKLAVNGKVVSGGSQCNPLNGYICLESEGSEVHFRNIRIQELPSTGAPPEKTAPLAQGFRTLYTGVDLSGWDADERAAQDWQVRDWRLIYAPENAADAPAYLWGEADYGDFELIVDCRRDSVPGEHVIPVVLGDERPLIDKERLSDVDTAGGDWVRYQVTVQDGQVDVSSGDGERLVEKVPLERDGRSGRIGLVGGGESTQFANIFIKELE